MRPKVSRISLAAADRIGLAVRAFRVHIDESHRSGAERIGEIAIAGITFIRSHPGGLKPPVDVEVGFPDIRASAGETESLEAHRFESDVAGENHQIGPGNFLAIFLFDGPQQTARAIEVDVVRPAIEGSETLLAAATATATVTDAIGSGAVPGHANKKRTVVAEVRRPPVLRVRHERSKILLQRVVVETLEFFRVVKILAHGIG